MKLKLFIAFMWLVSGIINADLGGMPWLILLDGFFAGMYLAEAIIIGLEPKE